MSFEERQTTTVKHAIMNRDVQKSSSSEQRTAKDVPLVRNTAQRRDSGNIVILEQPVRLRAGIGNVFLLQVMDLLVIEAVHTPKSNPLFPASLMLGPCIHLTNASRAVLVVIGNLCINLFNLFILC